MPTTTKTTLPRRELPRLSRERPPQGIEALGGPFPELAAKCKETMRAAVMARSAFERAERAVEAAADQDRAAFREAALNGKQDPGRTHELAATAEAEKLHREAEGATLAVNAVRAEIRQALRGEPGKQGAVELHTRLDKVGERRREHCEPLLDDLAEEALVTALVETVETEQKSDRPYIAGGRGPEVEGLERIHVNGGGNAPAHLVELLKEYDPRREP
ncbi:MAG: hypothetical protein AABM66_11910 [Actinomycetota bacterium]